MKIMKKKKSGRYSVRNVEKRKKNRREVISYEDVPLEEYNDERTQISKPAVKRIFICLALIIVLGLVVFLISNSDSLTPDRISNWLKYDVFGSHDNGYPVQIIGTSINDGNFLCDGDISYVSDTSFESLSSTGNEIGYNQHSFAKPVMCTAGDNVLIYNLGGNGFVTGTKKQLGSTKDTEKYIITADINSRGYYAVVTEADGYLSKLFVYNNDKEKVYTYSFAEYYITSVALNDAGTGCVVCGVTGDNGSLLGAAYVLDFTSEEPVATYPLDENIIYGVEYLNSSTVCMVGNSSAYMLNIGASKLSQVEYQQMELTAFDIDSDTDSLVLSLSRSGDGRKCSIEYVNRDGEVLAVNDTDCEISSISLYKNRIAALDNTTCYLFDTAGNELGDADAGIGAKAIRLENTANAYVLGINEIRKISEFNYYKDEE
ncbi:MAG: hypothetical protein J1E96_04370 [Ruminococcus sp.]|nr:hypothetical protein [Ruminococcus sp.]